MQPVGDIGEGRLDRLKKKPTYGIFGAIFDSIISGVIFHRILFKAFANVTFLELFYFGEHLIGQIYGYQVTKEKIRNDQENKLFEITR